MKKKKLSHGASNSLTICQRKMQLLQTKQALIQKEYELYRSAGSNKNTQQPYTIMKKLIWLTLLAFASCM